MRISDWSSDVCSSDLAAVRGRDGPRRGRDDDHQAGEHQPVGQQRADDLAHVSSTAHGPEVRTSSSLHQLESRHACKVPRSRPRLTYNAIRASRSEEPTSELQSLMRLWYAVFCLKKKNPQNIKI